MAFLKENYLRKDVLIFLDQKKCFRSILWGNYLSIAYAPIRIYRADIALVFAPNYKKIKKPINS